MQHHISKVRKKQRDDKRLLHTTFLVSCLFTISKTGGRGWIGGANASLLSKRNLSIKSNATCHIWYISDCFRTKKVIPSKWLTGRQNKLQTCIFLFVENSSAIRVLTSSSTLERYKKDLMKRGVPLAPEWHKKKVVKGPFVISQTCARRHVRHFKKDETAACVTNGMHYRWRRSILMVEIEKHHLKCNVKLYFTHAATASF